MQIPLVDLKKQYQGLRKEILGGIDEALTGMQLFLGKNVQAFESEFATFCNAKYGIGVGSGTDALHLALLACGIGPGDEVITVSHTFFATVEAIALVGATPVLVDIDPKTYTMDASRVEAVMTPRTKAIIPVHLYGHPADMGSLIALARKHNVRVIEDACQAHGAEYDGKRTGSLGDVGCFSFYFTKNLGAYGESGMITTSDPEIANSCRYLRDHGSEAKYVHSRFGVNGRLDEIQATILRIKLPHLDEWTARRREIAQMYTAQLPRFLVKPREMAWGKHVYHVYVIRTPERDELRNWLDKKGIGTSMHYPIPIHLQDAWKKSGYGQVHLPVTEQITKEIISLPIYPELTDEEVAYVCSSIRDFAESRLGSSDRVANSLE